MSSTFVADARVRQLHSANTRTLVVSWTRSSFGDGTFAAAGPQVWNSLLTQWTVIQAIKSRFPPNLIPVIAGVRKVWYGMVEYGYLSGQTCALK